MTERRQFPRTIIRKPGEIVCAPVRLPCSILNMSPTGMGVRLLLAEALPKLVEVNLDYEDTVLPAKVRWQNGCDVGLEFLGKFAFEPAATDPICATLSLRPLKGTEPIDNGVLEPDWFGSRTVEWMNKIVTHLKR